MDGYVGASIPYECLLLTHLRLSAFVLIDLSKALLLEPVFHRVRSNLVRPVLREWVQMVVR
jgi:hypothetical protein